MSTRRKYVLGRANERRGSLPAAIVVGGLSVVAVAGLVSRSLRPGALIGGDLSGAAWRRVLADDAFRESVTFTLFAALAATLVAVAIAVPLGIAVRSRDWPTRAVLGILLPVPHLVVAATTVAWFGAGRLVDRTIGELPIVGDGLGLGVILVYVIKEIPFLVVLVVVALDRATKELDEAAQSLGAGARDRWRFVIGPRLRWPVGLGALVVAAFVVGSTEVPLVIGPLKPDSITTYALNVTRVRGPIARADAAVALTVSTLLVIALAVGTATAVGLRGRGQDQQEQGRT